MEEKTELMKTEEEEQLDQLYYDLGKAYYEGGYEDPIPQLLPMFDAITSLKKKIEEEQALDNELHETFTDLEDLMVKPAKDDVLDDLLDNQESPEVEITPELIDEIIEEVNQEQQLDAIVCPSCGSSNPAGTKFCGTCGTKLIPVPEKVEEPVGVLDDLIEEPVEEKVEEPAPVVEEVQPETITCPNCGSENKAGTKFCGTCGTKLIPVPAKVEEPVGVLDDLIEEPVEEKVEEPAPVVEAKPETVTCPNCGSENKPGTKFCGKCGTKLIPAPVKVEEPAPVVEAKPETITCPNCGSENKPGTKFCGKCGTKLIPVPVKVEEPAPVVEAKPETVTCPTCGSINKAGTKFCGKCGTKLIQPVVQQPKKEEYIGTFCPSCGKKITTNSKFCGSCGYNLSK